MRVSASAAEKTVVLAAAALLFALSGNALAREDVDRVAVQARLESLQNFSAEFRSEVVYTPPTRTLPPKMEARASPRARRTDTWTEVFRFRDGMAYGDARMTPETLAATTAGGWPAVPRVISTYSPGRAEQMLVHVPANRWGGSIRHPGALEVPELWTLDIALGLRPYRRQEYLRPAEFAAAKLVSDDERVISLSLEDKDRNRHVWKFDKKAAYAVRSYTVELPNGEVFETFEASDFRSFGNTVLPMKVVRRGVYKDEAGVTQVAKTVTLQVAKYVVPDPANVPERFLIVWPKGSLVREDRAKVQLEVNDHDRALDDVAVNAEIARRDEEQRRLTEKAKDRIGKILSTTQPAK